MKVLVIERALVPSDIPLLCRRARVLLEEGDDAVILCDVGKVEDPDAVLVDALARLQLVAKRAGREIRILHAGRELRDLLDFVGLRDVVALYVDLGVEPGRQSEQGEHALGVEEETDAGDLTI